MAEEERFRTIPPLSRSGEQAGDSIPAPSGIHFFPRAEVSFSFAKMVESLPGALLVVDDQWRIVIANASARQLLRASPRAFLGYSARRFFTKEKLEETEAAFGSGEERHVFRDRVSVSSVSREIDVGVSKFASGGRSYWSLTIEDVTDRDRGLAELRQSQFMPAEEPSLRLEHAHHLEALGQLTGTLAHDFNNLLSVMLASLDGAMRRVERGQDPTMDLRRAMSATERSIQTTSQILRYSRRRERETESAQPKQVLSEIQLLLERAVGAGATLSIVVMETGSVPIPPSHLETAILNLVVNARDAVGESGEIVVTLSLRSLEESEAILIGLVSGSYVSIVVSDSGPGMDDEVKRHAFEPFYTTKPLGAGTGLGLSTVQSLMHKFGGAVLLESGAGMGTRVELLLPEIA